MEIVWRGDAVAVRDVLRGLGDTLAYTTVMTTLDRLFKKGLLAREKQGNAFVYRAAISRDAYHRRLIEEAVGALLARSADPVLAGFVDAAAASDEKNLGRLERLIAERRKAKR
jgi:predicted transcriptional regulator